MAKFDQDYVEQIALQDNDKILIVSGNDIMSLKVGTLSNELRNRLRDEMVRWASNIAQTTGDSELAVMSQKAVTDNLSNVITLSAILSGGVVSALNVGEYGYNTTANEIYFKTDENGGYTRQSPIKNAIYRYQGVYYKWNGTSLVEELNIATITKEINPVVLTGSAYIPLVSGHKYYFKNQGNAVNIFAKVTSSDSESITIAYPLRIGESIYYTASVDTSYISLIGSSSISVLLEEKDTLVCRVTELEEKSDETSLFTLNNNFDIANGEKIIFKNTTDHAINVFARVSSDSANIAIAEPLSAGSSIIYTSEQTTSIVRTSDAGVIAIRGTSNTGKLILLENNFKGTDNVPTANSDNFVKSGGIFNSQNVITLSVMNSGGTIAALEEGQYGYNTTTKLVYFKKDGNGIQIPMNTNAIYRYNNTYYKWNGSNLEKEIDINDIGNINHELYKVTITNSGNYSMISGKSYFIKNIGSATVNIFVKESPSSEQVIQIGSGVHSGGYFIYTAEQDINYIYMFGSTGTFKIQIEDLSSIEGRISKIERGDYWISYEHSDFIIEAGEKVFFKNIGTVEANVFVRVTESSDNIVVARPLKVGQETLYIAEQRTTYLLSLGNGVPIIQVVRGSSLTGRIKLLENKTLPSPVEIIPNTELKDVSAIRALMDYTNLSQQNDVLEQIYNNFDKLMVEHPNYITKFDPMASENTEQVIVVDGVIHTITVQNMADVKMAMATSGFSDYPEYAKLNGEAGQTDHAIELDDESVYTFRYEATPSYKTYMYKLIDTTPTRLYSSYPKKKVILTGAVHGNEIAAPFNLFMFAKYLAEGTDEIYSKMRSQFDFYIMPCVNGYGMYHILRGNANRVNINRNFPLGWVLQGNDLENVSSRSGNNYSGPTAGSEFETQLVMAVFNFIKPEVAIDHHNYSHLERQFYTEMHSKAENLPLVFRALELCSYSFRKHLPSYFGSNYKLFIADTYESSPVGITPPDGKCGAFFEAKASKFGCTIEISQNINYINGEYSASLEDNFGNNAFSVGEYTLRTQMAIYLNEVLKM